MPDPLNRQPRRPLGSVLAEDAIVFREGIVGILEKARHTVIAVVEDAEALQAYIALDRPDAVIADIRMPPTESAMLASAIYSSTASDMCASSSIVSTACPQAAPWSTSKSSATFSPGAATTVPWQRRRNASVWFSRSWPMPTPTRPLLPSFRL